MTLADWLAFFSFHEPTPAQRLACIRIRSAVGQLVDAYVRHSPAGPEQTSNLRKLKECQTAMIGHIVNELSADAFK